MPQTCRTVRRTTALLGLALAAAIVTAWGRGTLAAVAALAPDTAADPLALARRGGLLYASSLAVAACASLVYFTPGLLAAIAAGAATSVERALLWGSLASVGLVSTATEALEELAGRALGGVETLLLTSALAVAGWAAVWYRRRRGHALAWPLDDRHAGATFAAAIALGAGVLVGLSPKFYWDNFNGDGAHALEAARLLLAQPLPFFPPEAGGIRSFPGATSMLFLFPAAWMVRVAGEIEVSMRLPLIWWLVAVMGGIVAVACRRRPALDSPSRWLIALALSVYTVTMGYSATYNPYSADLTLPATQDTLLVACFLAFVLAFSDGRRAATVAALCFTVAASPNGGLLVLLWLLAVMMVWRPRPRTDVAASAAALAACLAAGPALSRLLLLVGHPAPGEEYGFRGLLVRFAFLQWDAWERALFVVVPGGIVPALGLLLVSRMDREARALAALVAMYFALFYVQAYVSLHHFAPIMLLPLAAFWRMEIDARWRQPVVALTGMAAVAALVLSWPVESAPHLAAKEIGQTMAIEAGDYRGGDRAVLRRAEILHRLFPYDWDASVPHGTYGGSPLAWNYYAQRFAGPPPARYRILRQGDPAPDGMVHVATMHDVALYVADVDRWQQDRRRRPPTPAGAPIYAIPRGMLFRGVPLEGHRVIALVDVLRGWGIDVSGIVRWYEAGIRP